MTSPRATDLYNGQGNEHFDRDVTIVGTSKSNRSVVSGWGTTTFTPQQKAVFYVQGYNKPLIIEPNADMILGRGSNHAHPELDMNAYDGMSMGVSRQHARLHHNTLSQELQLIDMGSTNGTFVNEEQLSPEQPHTLQDGDTIRLGQLVIHIYFK